MTQPATKTVLGRVFMWSRHSGRWECRVSSGWLVLEWLADKYMAGLTLGENNGIWVAIAHGNSESDAILALQSTLRKMAELEVAGG